MQTCVTEGTIMDTLNDLTVFQYKSLTNLSCNFKSPNFWVYDGLLSGHSPIQKCKFLHTSAIINFKKAIYIYIFKLMGNKNNNVVETVRKISL